MLDIFEFIYFFILFLKMTPQKQYTPANVKNRGGEGRVVIHIKNTDVQSHSPRWLTMRMYSYNYETICFEFL